MQTFDQYGANYKEVVQRSIDFAGLQYDFFVKAKIASSSSSPPPSGLIRRPGRDSWMWGAGWGPYMAPSLGRSRIFAEWMCLKSPSKQPGSATRNLNTAS